MMSAITTRMLAHASAPASAIGGRLFRKEVLRAGAWIHPTTGEPIRFGVPDLAAIAAESNRWIASQGGRVPFPDGHRFDAQANLGYWHAFALEGDRLLGIVEAGTDEVATRLGSTIRDVSVYIEAGAVDSQGRRYRDAITHVAATSYPVVTGQENFVALAAGAGAPVTVPIYRPAAESKEAEMPLMKLAQALGIDTEGKDETALAEAIKAHVSDMDERTTKATQALSARGDESHALSVRVKDLEAEVERRERADCDREVGEVKALCARHNAPEALAPEREKHIRDRWLTDREAAKHTLSLARELAEARGPVAGAKPVKTEDKAAKDQAMAADREARIAQARALGREVVMDAGVAFAVMPGGERVRLG